MSKCLESKIIPAFLPILSPSGKPTQMQSLRFVEVYCDRVAGHKGACKSRAPRKRTRTKRDNI